MKFKSEGKVITLQGLNDSKAKLVRGNKLQRALLKNQDRGNFLQISVAYEDQMKTTNPEEWQVLQQRYPEVFSKLEDLPQN